MLNVAEVTEVIDGSIAILEDAACDSGNKTLWVVIAALRLCLEWLEGQCK